MIVINYRESVPKKGDLTSYGGVWYRVSIGGVYSCVLEGIKETRKVIIETKTLSKGFRGVSLNYFKENHPEYYI